MRFSRRSFVLGAGAVVTGAAFAPAAARAAGGTTGTPPWLAESVLYQLYPQSFADGDGSGVGDLRGIVAHLDHLEWLGVDAIWVNPVFPSPLTDAGYDIADYTGVHPRYGDEQDVVLLVEEARRRGMRVLFDLVAGHTSDQHPWFLGSLRDDTDHRYIWASPEQLPEDGSLPEDFVASPGPRAGAFRKNYYDTQPAINYGYARTDPAEPWRQAVDADGPRRNRDEIFQVMDHWLRLGIAGFRCDLAATLVKDDPGWVETGRLWGDLRARVARRHPDAVLISEWGDPETSVPAGFDADFYLPVNGPGDGAPWKSLWHENPYFGAAGTGSPKVFIDAWTEATERIGRGRIMLPTANHDSANRLNDGVRTPQELPAAFAFLLTWPIVPALYYGEEIGMRMVDGLPEVEGSAGRQRNRTPMQWDGGPNAGFSTAPAEQLYLPIDPDPQRPTVAGQRDDPGSLLNLVRRLLALRKRYPELGTRADVRVLADGYPLTYLRGDRFLVTTNPRREPAAAAVPDARLAGARIVEDGGARVDGDEVVVPGFGYGVFDLAG
ncbi:MULTISPECIES: alpha-amylase family glycosyl hydrolase [unclassified Saccharopolyspora]|uniref:alpha-amylase family glycosyl hydrolase n=1 Tax=unclassified Saccharopolyspora TaxID=2646250 RepID=UPI001CD5F49E|nr:MULTISPECIES: alpha-amylase family glycosyl hydrolase [unclassified Saccharopolyspora]MCA1191404.1 oligo-1,6-glucosidase [Saccharopolyspora sp. 6V]MCA1278514.1 oligo-1,6-glucosidase [Saccharopolyspora sp. 7B]